MRGALELGSAKEVCINKRITRLRVLYKESELKLAHGKLISYSVDNLLPTAYDIFDGLFEKVCLS
jgi:hypothetical protein